MSPSLQQIISLLTSPNGSLAYHIVLAFSITAAFFTALILTRGRRFPPLRRLVTGLALLLAGRLALFGVTALATQGVIDPGLLLLPVLDRLVTLVSLLFIIWLWAFPDPARSADAGAVLLGLLAIAVVTLTAVWWQGQQVEVFETAAVFNGSFPDQVAGILALLLIGIGLLLLVTRRPPGWGLGLSMLLFSLLGHLAHLLFPAVPGAYSGVVRLAQLTAYSLLLFLPLRFPVSLPAEEAAPGEETGLALLPDALRAFLELAAGADPETSCQALTAAVGRAMQADICLYLSPPWTGEQLVITCGYDLANERPVAPAELETAKLPVLASALRQSRALRLPASRSTPELARLGKPLGLEHTGPLLVAPLATPDGDPLAGLVLLSPYTRREWTQKDQAALDELKQPLARFLQHQEQVAVDQAELPELRETAQAAQQWLDEAQAERDRLVTEKNELQQAYNTEHDKAESLAALLAAREDLHETVERLQSENETLKQQLHQAPAAEAQQLEGELRLALEEIAMLKAALSEADQKTLTLHAPLPGAELVEDQADAIASIAQDLRQPVAKILESTDLLLAEKVGILVTAQRRSLEKTRIEIERINRMLDDLVQAALVNRQQAQSAAEPVDLPDAVRRVVDQFREPMRKSRLSLQLDLPESLPHLRLDRQALEEVLAHLLQNAVAATPERGEIRIHTRLERTEGQPDYVLLQVIDHGDGIPAAELPYIFSPNRPPSGSGPVGVGTGRSAFARVRSLVESQGGHIMVDSEEGQGATFSVLLPVPEDDFPHNGQPRRAV